MNILFIILFVIYIYFACTLTKRMFADEDVTDFLGYLQMSCGIILWPLVLVLAIIEYLVRKTL